MERPYGVGVTWVTVPSPFGEAERAYLCRADLAAANQSAPPGRGALGAPRSALEEMDAKAKVVWTEQEDQLLLDLIEKYGTTKWSLIASKIPTKSNRHCRRRWQACVNANGNKGIWTREEDERLLKGHRLFGNRWTEIAKLVPGRTDNAAKNRFQALVKAGDGPVDGSYVLENGSDSVSVSVSRSESAVTGDTCERAGQKRAREEADTAENGKNFMKKVKPHLDLNCSAKPCFSDSESSVVHEGERERKEGGGGRLWLDLNSPCSAEEGNSFE